MRNLVWSILGAGMLLAASPASAQRYDPAYAFCADLADENGSRMECFYMSMEQCKEASKGMPGTCLKNPFYKPPPEPTPVAEPAPSPSPVPAKKKKKS